MTTKSGLTRTLYQNSHPNMHVDRWFPRCYDLTEAGGVEELVEDTERTAAMIIVRKAFNAISANDQASRLMRDAHEKLQALRA